MTGVAVDSKGDALVDVEAVAACQLYRKESAGHSHLPYWVTHPRQRVLGSTDKIMRK